jgi:GT2 family glycosyltransferase
MSRVGVVLVAWEENAHLLRRAVEDWRRQLPAPETICAVVNGEHEIRSGADYEVVTGENLGFAGGVNRGARRLAEAGIDVMIVANLDLHLLSSRTADVLVHGLVTHPDAFAFSPGIVFWPRIDLVWYRGGQLLRPSWVTRHPGMGRRWRGGGGVRPTEFFSGCLAALRLGRFLELGGFDERLLAYYEDVELSFRARQRGWPSYLLDLALAGHEKEPGQGFRAHEAFLHARNASALRSRYESGWSRHLGELEARLLRSWLLLRRGDRQVRKAWMLGERGLVSAVRAVEMLRPGNRSTVVGPVCSTKANPRAPGAGVMRR